MVYGPPSIAFLDLPQLRESVPAHPPLAAVYTIPWPGRVAVWRSPGEDGFELVTTLGRPARMGRLVADLYPGPTSRFDLGNVAIVDLAFGTLASVTDVALFAGANALAVEAAPGTWEVLQFGVAELIAPGRYRLTRLLRGQRGTEVKTCQPSAVRSSSLAVSVAMSSRQISTWCWTIGLSPQEHWTAMAVSATHQAPARCPPAITAVPVGGCVRE